MTRAWKGSRVLAGPFERLVCPCGGMAFEVSRKVQTEAGAPVLVYRCLACGISRRRAHLDRCWRPEDA